MEEVTGAQLIAEALKAQVIMFLTLHSALHIVS